jgi:ketosteroid isomerase-like protein
MAAEDDIALIRRAYAAWTSGDVEQVLEVIDDEIEVEPVLGDVVSADTFRGKDGVRRWYESIHSALEDFRADLQEIVEAGDGRYLALLRFSGRGIASGAPVALDAAHVLTIRDGLCVKLVGYESWDEARRAL